MTDKNLILVIGNGFDLAHGLRTSFANFANHYIQNKIVPELNDVIANRKEKSNLLIESFTIELVKKDTLNSSEKAIDFIWQKVALYNQPSGVIQYLRENPEKIKEFLKNRFLGKLYANSYRNWFDIENAYFSELIKIKEVALTGNPAYKLKLKQLNQDFEEIKDEVQAYLKTIKIEFDDEINSFLENYIGDAKNVYVVNFNYTDTIEKYLKSLEIDQNIKVNYIHGNLESDNIIFGYGNDQNNDYQEIKELEIDGFLDFFKTFDYLSSSNYSNIYQEAIDYFKEYEVLILGHSLGTTDKTLLDEIINSDKCKKVRLFKRGDYTFEMKKLYTSYRKLTYAAGRILSDEKMLRKKVTNFEESDYFPLQKPIVLV